MGCMGKSLLFQNKILKLAGALFLIHLFCVSCKENISYQRTYKATSCSNLYPIKIEENLLISSSVIEYPALVLIDKYTGEKKWTWVDSSNLICGAYYNLEAYFAADKVVLPLGKTVLVLNAKDGREIFRKKYDAIEGKIDGNGELVSYINYNYTPFKVFVNWLDLKTMNCKSFEIPIEIDSNKSARVLAPLIVTSEGDDIVAYTSAIITDNSKPESGFLLKMFSRSGRNVEYDMPQEILKYNFTKSFKEYNDKLIGISFNRIYAFSDDYSISWKVELSKPVLSSDLVIDGSTCFIATEDSYVYKIDLEKGNIVDKVLTKHLMGRGYIVKDTLYYISDFDNKMYCINTNNMIVEKRYCSDNEKVSKIFYKDEEMEVVTLNGIWKIIKN